MSLVSTIRESPPEFSSSPNNWKKSSLDKFNGWRRESQENFEVLDSPPVVLARLKLRSSPERILSPLSLKTETAAVQVLNSKKSEKGIGNFEQRFKEIDRREEKLKSEFHPEAEKPEALRRNRYNNVKPTSLGLIFLKHHAPEESGYINANQFEGMIVTQAPFIKKHFDLLTREKIEIDTVVDFWLLALFEHGTDIVCLTDQMGLNENYQEVEKTFPYWKTIDKEIVFKKALTLSDQVQVELEVRLVEGPNTAVKPDKKNQCVTHRRFEIRLGDQKKLVDHWYFEKWKDHSVCNPNQLAVLIDLLLAKPGIIPMYHCSAGLGRAGACAIIHKFADRFLKEGVLPTETEIDDAVIELRKRRPRSVQSPQQLNLISTTLTVFAELQRKKDK